MTTETPRERRKWIKDEDIKLQQLVTKYGTKNWRIIASHLPHREPKQCRERWMNHLDPSVVKGRLTEREWQVLLKAHEEFGNRWTEIAKMLPGRTPNHIKNHWHARMRKGRKRKRSDSPTSGGVYIMESESGSESGDENDSNSGSHLSKKRKLSDSTSNFDCEDDSDEDEFIAFSDEQDEGLLSSTPSNKLDALVMMAEFLYRQEQRSEKPYVDGSVMEVSQLILNTSNFVGEYETESHHHLLHLQVDGSPNATSNEYEQSTLPMVS